MLFRFIKALRAGFGRRRVVSAHNPEAELECGRLRALRLIYQLPR
jgi:hypothetical protein